MDENGLDEEALVNEATSMMSNLQGSNNLFDNLMKQASNLGGMPNPGQGQGQGKGQRQESTGNATRDRLRRKLEERKNKEK